MAEELYKISPEDADKVYKQWTDEHGIHRIIMAVNEQADGSLLVDKKFVDANKEDTEYKKIDWTKKAIITKEQVDSKDKEILIDGEGDEIIKNPK